MTEPQAAELVPVECECAADCGEQVLVTIDEYAAAHEQADYVLIRPGHPVEPGSQGPRVVTETPRYAVIAEGWALTEDEIPPASSARLAKLRATAPFRITCACVRCEAGSLADAAEVEITLDEWERFRRQRVVKAGHPTEGGAVIEQSTRFVVLDDDR